LLSGQACVTLRAMPRRTSPPRLWLRPARRDKSGRVTHQESYVILDHGQQITVGSDMQKAEAALAKYLAKKHSAGIAHRGLRATDEIPIADVLNLYMQDVAPHCSIPAEVANRCGRLLDFFDGKTLADLILMAPAAEQTLMMAHVMSSLGAMVFEKSKEADPDNPRYSSH
jgi:hypothetical protein